MIQKKIALLGAPGAGKTSLVRRFVESLFDEKYLTTIGVKVDKKRVQANGQELMLMIWDVAGPEEHFAIPRSYIRGASGYLLVVDGTRPDAIEQGRDIVAQVEGEIARLPFVVALNKSDLAQDWRINEGDLADFQSRGSPILRTSAKTGSGVEEAFQELTKLILTSPS